MPAYALEPGRALDALKRPAEAIRIYASLLQNNKSAEDDPCWESREWADALKSDCVYRIGVCYQHLGKRLKAESYYRQYLSLLSMGIEGTYTIDDVRRQMRALHRDAGSRRTKNEVQKLFNAAIQESAPRARGGQTSAAAIDAG